MDTYTMKLMKITPHLSKAEMACLLANPFSLPSMATTFEAEIGKAILKAERKAKHVQNMPNVGTNFGAGRLNAKKWLIKVRELVSALEGRPPQSRFQLGVILGCTKETAVRRAQEAIKQGLVCRITAKGHSAKDPIFRYTIANVQPRTNEEVAYMQPNKDARSREKSERPTWDPLTNNETDSLRAGADTDFLGLH
jgi:hypothetical protein